MYHNSKWWQSSQHDRLLQEYFKDSPIIIDYDFHKSQTIRDNRLVFGPWAGPERCITNIIHEMCHLVEIDDARILRHGWGLYMPEQYVPGRYAHIAAVPLTYQGTQREVRVMAMQWQLQNAFDIPCTPKDILQSLCFMPDWCYVPHGLTMGEFSYDEIEKSRFSFLEKELMKYAKGKYSLEFFNQEWIRKIKLLDKVNEEGNK